MEEKIQLVKTRVVTVLKSMPNDVDEMIHIASGRMPRRADCQVCKISICFLMHIHSKHCQHSPFAFYF